jgi:hypothetical protein
MFVQETNSPSYQQLSQEMEQKRALHNKPQRRAEKVIMVKGKSGRGGCKARCRRKTEAFGPISWTFETLSAGKGREEEEEY